MALRAVVFRRFVLQVAQRAVSVVWRIVGIGVELLGLGRDVGLLVALQAGVLVGIDRILHVGTMAGRAGDATLDVTVGAELFGGYCA